MGDSVMERSKVVLVLEHHSLKRGIREEYELVS